MKVLLISEDELKDLIKNGVKEAFEHIDFTEKSQYQVKDILTIQEAASLLGTSPAALASLRCKKKGIPYYKAGRRVLYRYKDILAYMENNRVRIHPA